MRKILMVLVLVSSFAVAVPTASALTWHGHTAYVLRNHHARCARNYYRETIKVKGRRTVGCVYRRPSRKVPTTTTTIPTTTTTTPVANTPVAATTTTTTPTVAPSYTYAAQLDPSFVQSSANPKAVVYTYSASATVNGQLVQSLPSGVLELYSDGLLACSVNVGGSTTGSTCGVTYSAFGSHQVVTTYIPNGVTAVTETDTEKVEPFSTSVAISTPLLGSTVDISNYAYQVVTVPVTVSGLTSSLGTTGTVSLTDGTGTGEGCTALVYNSSLGSATASCTAEIEDDPSVVTSWTPKASFSGDVNYSSTGTTGSSVSIPAAPAPTVTDVAVTLQCDESGGWCTAYNSSAGTTDARTNVFAGNPAYNESPGIGTVTFTSADNLTICSAAVEPAYLGPDSAARCVGAGGPFTGPISVSYSGGTVETGDTTEVEYSSATTSGGSN